MAGGIVSNWSKTRRERKIKKVSVVGPQKKAGIGMGREELKEGVERILRTHFPDRSLRGAANTGASAYVEMHMTRSLEELGEAKERMMREAPPDLLVLIGGDGNTQKTLGQDEEFLRHLTADPEHATEVVVIGGGTKNVVPTALKLLGDDPLEAFDVICQKIVRNIPRKTEPCPILKINGRHGFIYGSGVVVNALDAYYEHDAGPSRAFKTGLGVVWRETLGRAWPWRKPSIFRRFGAQVSWRDAAGEMRAVDLDRFNGFVASSLLEINPWLKITHRTGERLACFHGIGLNNGFFRNVLNLPAMIIGGPMLGSVRDMVTDRMVIRYDQPMRHTIDGELYEDDKLGRPEGVPEAEADRTVVIETGPFITFVTR